MLEILNNSWVVGIGGGILSGLTVTVITRAFLEKKDDRELLQRVTVANKELTYAIRPCIAEGSIPSLGVIDSLIAATARKYRLPSEKLSTSRLLIDDLIKEVMDSSFISASRKAEYCAKLNHIFEHQEMKPLLQAKTGIEVAAFNEKMSRDIDGELGYKEYRQRLLSKASVMMGIMVWVMTTAFAFINLDIFQRKSESLEPLKTLLPMLATIMAVAVTVLTANIASKITAYRYENKRESENDDDSKKRTIVNNKVC